MSFRSTLKLDSQFFKPSARRKAGGRAVHKTVREFAEIIQEKMESSPHTGAVVTKARGAGFRVSHQQSRRGERPAPFTRTLLRSVKGRKTGELSGEVSVGAEYAERLLNLGRVIVSNEDRREGQKLLDKNSLNELKGLL